MAKVRFVATELDGTKVWEIDCPGCKYGHPFHVGGSRPNERWTFNGDLDAPTFAPSLLVNKDRPEGRCHSFVKKGNIQFLNDCFHDLKGQTVPLPDVEP